MSKQRTITLPTLEPWQLDVWNEMKESKGSGKMFVVKAKRQIGKSLLASLLLIKFALEQKTTNAIVEPTLNQSRRVFKQITSMMEGSQTIKNANASLLTIDFVNGSELIFKSAEQKDSLRGYTISGLLVIDEGAFIQDDIYDTIFPWVDANNAPVLIISTPLFEDGMFFKLYSDKNTISFDWSKYDTSKYLPKEKLLQYKETLSVNKFKSEYLGEFITEGSYVFGDISKCISNNILSKDNIFLGIDWSSGIGSDYTFLTFMNEHCQVTRLEYFNNLEPTEQIDRIANYINQERALKKIQVEMNSIGAIYYDLLKRKVSSNIEIVCFNTNNDSKRRIIEQLVTAFQNKDITIPNDDVLISHLQHYAIEKTTKGYTYNAVSGYHDDGAISLALCYDLFKHNNGSYKVHFGHSKRKPTLQEKREKTYMVS